MSVTDKQTVTVDITPSFVYTEPVEEIKLFLEKLRAAYGTTFNAEDVEDVLIGNTSIGLYGVTQAMKDLLTQDIEFQIATKIFPLPKRPRA